MTARSLSPVEADLIAARHEVGRLRATLEGIASSESGTAQLAAAKALEPQPLDLATLPESLTADDVELEWRDGDFAEDDGEPGRRFDRTEDRSPLTFLRRVAQVRDVLGMMWQSVDGLDPDDVRDMHQRLDDAVADFRGDRMPRQLSLLDAEEVTP